MAAHILLCLTAIAAFWMKAHTRFEKDMVQAILMNPFFKPQTVTSNDDTNDIT